MTTVNPTKPHISPWTTSTSNIIMDPSWSPAAVDTPRSASSEPVPNASSQSELAPDRQTKSHHLISKLEALKNALYACNKDHKCKDLIGLTVPTRLLYVGRHGTDKIRVVICSEEAELMKWRPAAYAALSYCWGTCPALKSTRANLAYHKRGLSISEIPLTLQDAVRVTRDLGLLYLWVDALCILQDCEEDWRRESGSMGDVYGHAFVTIFAFGARDCQGGLFSPADQEPTPISDMPLLRFVDEPLNHRAWALQEWHLSPRRLIFTSYDAIFDCLQGPQKDFGNDIYSHRLLPSSTLSPMDWNFLVTNYSSRALTDPLDKLPAISGLAQSFDKFSNGRNGRYLAGLWEAHLPSALLWRRISIPSLISRLNSARPTAYIAPTWSWASINGTVEFVTGMHKEQNLDVVAQVTSVDLGPAADKNHSRPMVYKLGLRSQMKSLQKDSWVETKVLPTRFTSEEFTNLVLRAEGVQSTRGYRRRGTIWGDSIMRPFMEGPRPLTFCAIMTNKHQQLEDDVWGLLLVEVDHTTFKRIGCGFCGSSWFEDAVEHLAEII